jgi:hypothetical protein
MGEIAETDSLLLNIHDTCGLTSSVPGIGLIYLKYFYQIPFQLAKYSETILALKSIQRREMHQYIFLQL